MKKADLQQTTQFRSKDLIGWGMKAAGRETPRSKAFTIDRAMPRCRRWVTYCVGTYAQKRTAIAALTLQIQNQRFRIGLPNQKNRVTTLKNGSRLCDIKEKEHGNDNGTGKNSNRTHRRIAG